MLSLLLVFIAIVNCNANIPQSVPKEHINTYDKLQHRNGYKIKNLQGKMWPSPCNLQPGINMPFCNYSLSFEDRAKHLLKSMTINETLSQTSCWSGPIPRLNISFFGWWVDAAHGLGQHVNFGCFPTKSSTQFPQIINSGSTFNRTLWWQIGDIISTEGRAFANYGCSSLTYWDPNINIFRDPRWGRGQEVPGEDPFINAEYAINFVKGMQGNDSKYLKAGVTCKHYDAYSLEGSWGPNGKISRQTFNAVVSDYDFNDTYYPAFKYCVSQQSDHGQASGVMCSYNEVNGIPSCANKDLLTTALNKWNFDGYIVSDCWAVQQVETTHHYTSTPAQTINAVYNAGMNLECSNFIELNAWAAIQNGSVNINQISNQTINAIKVLMRLGYYDPPENLPWVNYNQTMVNTKYNQQVALDDARQSTVLLKNINNSYLPIKSSNFKTISVLGPNANDSAVLLGNYQGVPPFIVTALQGIESYISDGQTLNYNMGCDINSNNTINFSKSISYAKNSDLTILVMGINNTIESEGKDRHSLYLTGVQNEFIRNISNVTNNIILILINAGCIDVSEFQNDNNIKAILWAGYGGMYGGQGVADVIFGTFAPTGLNSQTWYLGNYVNEVNMTNMNMRPNSSVNYPGRGYKYYNGKSVLYPFGFGLQYTIFECNNLKIQNAVSSVTVKNIGNMNSGGVVLLYWIPNKYNVSGPIKRLVGFERINMLNIGQETNVNMNLYQEFYYSDEYQIKNMGYFKLGGIC